MKISYAISVCNEHRELDNLLYFLVSNQSEDEEIVILVDSTNVTDKVQTVLDKYSGSVKVHERAFSDRDFAAHKNYLGEQCKGDIIFNIDADEIPQEGLVDFLRSLDPKTMPDVLYVPRINICPGYTKKFVQNEGFQVNELGWINWPDYQGRIYKRGIKWEGKAHEKLTGGTYHKILKPSPEHALWHVKSVQRQTRQNELYRLIQAPDRVSQDH